jgi:hypothetical protein
MSASSAGCLIRIDHFKPYLAALGRVACGYDGGQIVDE